MEQTSFPKAGEKFLLCPLRPAQNNLPAEKKIRSALEKIASNNVLLDGTTRREMENVRWHCKHCGVDSQSEIPPSPSFALCFQTEEDKKINSGENPESIVSPRHCGVG
ncbi:hypothetical protein CEXT_512911 [Caerostris extrusa]|uniref:Uncharacterized protein n=1 Tax=Caerostris extrusa TaxID=172846 RepID=A0AAV4XHF8_CAEEX|nr:hypothetical protein CEXT_512911 [Caerostris extrusa]